MPDHGHEQLIYLTHLSSLLIVNKKAASMIIVLDKIGLRKRITLQVIRLDTDIISNDDKIQYRIVTLSLQGNIDFVL